MAHTSQSIQGKHASEIQTPERSLVQRMDALHEANRIRLARANLKRDLKAGRKSIRVIILNPPEYVMAMKLFDLMMACPKYGRVKVNKILVNYRISPAKTVGGLSSRQRAAIAAAMDR